MKAPISFRTLFLCILFILFRPTSAQMSHDGASLTWDDFLQEYADALNDASEDNAEAGLSEEETAVLEEMATRPLQLNRISRAEFLQLPFISEAQADTLLSYRESKRGICALGELMLLRGFDYRSRRWLSLFVRCDSAFVSAPVDRQRQSLRQRLKNGHHEVATLVEVPLYKRQGYKPTDLPTATNHFTGNAVRHLVRYRYALKQDVLWGLTMEKDQGEPVGKRGFCPYDHLSGYVFLHPADKRWTVCIGDFEVRGGRGLAFGRTLFSGRSQFAARQRLQSSVTFRPHTSAAEYGYFRGAAFRWERRHWAATAFASWRRLDARMEGDTVRSILQTGLHRTPREIERRRNLPCLTGGASLAYVRPSWGITLNALAARYAHPVSPERSPYSRDLFHGQTAAVASVAYHCRLGNVGLQGEGAIDRSGHLAAEHTLLSQWGRKWTANLQLRYLAPAFHSPYATVVQQGTQARNECGALAGVTFRPTARWEMFVTADIFQYPHPSSTTVLPHAKGYELSLGSSGSVSKNVLLRVRYRLKSRQYTVSRHDVMEYRTAQRLNFSLTYGHAPWSFTSMAYASHAFRQTGRQDWGVLLSERVSRAWKRWTWRALAAWFRTTDFASAVYAPDPVLLQSALATAFAHHGLHWTTALTYASVLGMEAGCRISGTRYFDVRSQSSGVMTIASPWKNDVSLYLRWRL